MNTQSGPPKKADDTTQPKAGGAKGRRYLTIAGAVVLALVILLVGYALGRRGARGAAPGGEAPKTAQAGSAKAGRSQEAEAGETYWTCPMHPEIVQDHPGECPICGMDLVEHKGAAAAAGESEVEGLVPVQLSDRDQQLIGVRTAVLENRRLKKTVRTYGNVEADETSLHTVNAKISGWIEKLYVNYTGEEVSQGQPLLSVYSPELVQTQEEYLVALRAKDKLSSSRFASVAASGDQLVQAARRRLELWDISDDQISHLERTGKAQKTLVLRSPTAGTVLERMATEGMQVMPGMPLLKLAELGRVWVQAALYDQDLPLVHEGTEADVTLEALPGEVFHGTVTFIEPVTGERTRSTQARIELENRGGRLKPDMYATVLIRVALGEVLALPREAVLDTGKRRIVFVDQGDGHFEPREVETGRETDDYFEVLSGVFAGDKIVTSGNFMIDAESRTAAAIRSRMKEASAKGTEQLWTCPMHPQIIRNGPGECPICGMDLVPAK